ncbi:Neuropeptide FF receptor 1 G-protein coupled receptor 147 RFamide-related peptide receptor [Triplophysa tibetana]|uniref:Neuropeptide FF receptor 1 n=1 Tax=Triplophysa tibetana TaxID=1572043 RepID=A0A5A9P4W3_9TELE|nr:Neuropeptide FF receptor 1 G-protein coupled receptor 147 RFamide-related peptide receptor [Triplophysa tibetana]
MEKEPLEMEIPDLSVLYSNSTLPYSIINGSNVTNLTSIIYYPYYQHSLPVAAGLTLGYLFIFLLCMVGNGLVCLIVLENRRMRTVTNLFILNLAVSDLLVGVFCIPTTLVDNLITGWPFTNTVCKMSGLVQGMSVSASVFTLVAIAVDRFRCIVYPFHPKLTLLVAKVTIVMIWMLAVVIMCPSAVMLTVERVEHHYMVHSEDYNHTNPLFSCFENWANPQMRKVYTTVLFAHIYLIPLTLITLMYGRIGIKLYTTSVITANDQHEGAQPHASTPNHRAQHEGRPLISQKKIKVIKMLGIVALLFTLSWLPLWTLMLLTDYGGLDDDKLELLTGYVFPFAHWLAFSNSSVNPIIYGYYNENFKRGFQAVCRTHSCCCGMSDGNAMCQKDNRGEVREPAVTFGARNRVYTDADLKNSGTRLEMDQKRAVQLCNSVCTNDTVSNAGSGIKGIAIQKVFQMEEPEKISPVRVGKNQAWDQ